MASSKTNQSPNDTNEVPSSSKQTCSSDDITEELQPSDSSTAVKAQKSGKLRRTALSFLGVRKTICILPSFFMGRSKQLNKWSSKKTIFKSKTHDGLSKVCHEDYFKGGDASAGDVMYHSDRDVAGNVHRNCHNTLSPSSADQKSLSLTRHKRGLKGLFQSIRHHRSNRNGVAKEEMFALSSAHTETGIPVVHDYTEQYLSECLKSEPVVPDCDKSLAAECVEADIVEKCILIQDGLESEFELERSDNQIKKNNFVAFVSNDYEGLSRVQSDPCLKLEMLPEPKLKSTTASSDQLNVMYEDVDSLKSFDSLTGCGDIIADQEDDSLTESTVSGERSRNGGKRASCYLTYQGGGEEMAFSEDFDEECLDDMWVNDASEEMCCACNQMHTDVSSDMTCSHNIDLLNSNSAPKAVDSSIADVITPQSERHESAPNSDEGYYDSTTPGPEETQEKSDRLRRERLPRDSYSGDALYELFAPDESLVSPHHERKSLLLDSKECEYFNKPEDFTNSAFLHDINNVQEGEELYEDQSFLEMPNSCSKSNELAQDALQSYAFGSNKQNNLNSNLKVVSNSNIQISTSAGKYLNAEHVKRHSGISFGSDSDFDTFCEHKEELLEENKPVALPYKNMNTRPTEVSTEVNEEQAVCFSQALEDYTKHTQMISTLHNNMNGLETSQVFIPNMEALPAIVTFDVVDMHNEGEYDDDLMQIDLEEDISSPCREFEESYLQKDAFAECDYQTLDPCEQNILSSTWAIASLPRNLGLTTVRQVFPAPLSHDRRSRSLDTEDLDFNMSGKYLDYRDVLNSSFDAKKVGGSSFSKKAHNVPLKNDNIASSWQTKSEMALSLSLTNMGINDVQIGTQTKSKTKTSVTPTSEFQNTKPVHVCSGTSNSASSDLFSNPKLLSRHCHLSDSTLPHNSFYYNEMIKEGSLLSDGKKNASDDAVVNMLCKGSVKTKPATRAAISPCSLNPILSINKTKFE